MLPLTDALKLRWHELPRLRELHGQIVPPEQDAQPFIVAMHAIRSEYITTILIAHALCEALINCALAHALMEQSRHELFVVLERAEFLDKWVVAPKAVVADYSFDKSAAVYETMRRMNKHRNFYLHNKAFIASGEEVVFPGSRSESSDLGSDMDWIHRYISLPFDLADFLRGFPEFITTAVLVHRGEIPRAPQHNA